MVSPGQTQERTNRPGQEGRISFSCRPPTHVGGYWLPGSCRRQAADPVDPTNHSADLPRRLPIAW